MPPAPRLSTLQVLDLFGEIAHPVLSEHLAPDCCLNASRITIEVMKRFSLGAQPVSVTAHAMNAVYADRVKAMGREATKVDAEEWFRIGGYSIGVDLEKAPDGKWAGHLVTIVGKEWLVDASARQFSRPQYNLTVPDVFVAQVPPRWLKGKEGANFQGPDGSVLSYRVREGDASWMQKPGWQASMENLGIADEITEKMKARIRGASR